MAYRDQRTPAPRINQALVVTNRSIEVRDDEEARYLLMRQTYFKDLDDLEWELFNAEASARGLSVLRKEYAAIKFGGEATYFPTIHGLRTLAIRSGRYAGSTTEWSADGKHWVDAWVEDTFPAAARCLLYVTNNERPFVGIAVWRERARKYRPRDSNIEKLQPEWEKQPAHMLGKCAERDALAKSGIISDADKLPDVDPFDAPQAIAREVATDWGSANRNAHRAAKAIGTGIAHDIVRETIAAQNPAATSVRDATVVELNQAAEALDFAGLDAASLFDPEEETFDPETGEAEPSPAELWRATVESVLVENQQTAASLQELRRACNGDAWKWAIVIAHPRLSDPAAMRFRDFGRRETNSDPAIDKAFDARADAKTIAANASTAKTKEAQATVQPRQVATMSDLLGGGDHGTV